MSSRIHGLSTDVLRELEVDSPELFYDTPADAFRDLEMFFETDKYERVELIAHNGKNFDDILLRSVVPWVVDEKYSFFDTIEWFRQNYPALQCGYSLGALYSHFKNKSLVGAHRAENDTLALVELYKDLIEDSRPPGALGNDTPPPTALSDVRYLGDYRIGLLKERAGIETLSAAIEWAKRKTPRELFAALSHVCDMKSVTERVIVASKLLGLTECDMLNQVFTTTSTRPSNVRFLNDADYYVYYRFVTDSEPLNQVRYKRGLFEILESAQNKKA